MNIKAVFRPLAELERAMADLYAHFSEVFASDRELSFAFFKLAAEERGHASLVDYQKRMVQQNQALAVDVDVDLSAVEQALALIAALRRSPAPPSVGEAIRAALALESGAAETHYKNALKAARPEIARLLDALGGDDTVHAARLRALATARAVELPDAS